MTEAPGAARQGEAPDVQDSAIACGAYLRQARESYGLSIDAVSQQLKLAPRQVQALEEGRFDLLPGRTFVRGFLRNYARLLRLDADALLATLPEPGGAESLAATRPPMGEIRFDASRERRSWSRWAIPLVLIAMVALAALYEYSRPPGERRAGERQADAPPHATAGTSAGNGTPLPNPLAGMNAPAPGTDVPPAPAAPGGAPPALPAASEAPAAGSASAAPAAASGATAAEPAKAGEGTVVILFNGTSWAEVKDASGRTLLTTTGNAGMTQSVTGPVPLDVVIGNVANVSVRFRGAPVDLSPYARTNVARLRLQ